MIFSLCQSIECLETVWFDNSVFSGVGHWPCIPVSKFCKWKHLPVPRTFFFLFKNRGIERIVKLSENNKNSISKSLAHGQIVSWVIQSPMMREENVKNSEDARTQSAERQKSLWENSWRATSVYRRNSHIPITTVIGSVRSSSSKTDTSTYTRRPKRHLPGRNSKRLICKGCHGHVQSIFAVPNNLEVPSNVTIPINFPTTTLLYSTLYFVAHTQNVEIRRCSFGAICVVEGTGPGTTALSSVRTLTFSMDTCISIMRTQVIVPLFTKDCNPPSPRDWTLKLIPKNK